MYVCPSHSRTIFSHSAKTKSFHGSRAGCTGGPECNNVTCKKVSQLHVVFAFKTLLPWFIVQFIASKRSKVSYEISPRLLLKKLRHLENI